MTDRISTSPSAEECEKVRNKMYELVCQILYSRKEKPGVARREWMQSPPRLSNGTPPDMAFKPCITVSQVGGGFIIDRWWPVSKKVVARDISEMLDAVRELINTSQIDYEKHQAEIKRNVGQSP